MEEREKPAQVGREERGRAFIPVRRRTDSLKNCQQLRASFLPSFLPTLLLLVPLSRVFIRLNEIYLFISLSLLLEKRDRSSIDRYREFIAFRTIFSRVGVNSNPWLVRGRQKGSRWRRERGKKGKTRRKRLRVETFSARVKGSHYRERESWRKGRRGVRIVVFPRNRPVHTY